MLRFCANITTLYGSLPLRDALAAAQADGFAAVECRTPFGDTAEIVRDWLDALGLTMVQFNLPMGDFAAGDRGIACVPGREAEFRASVDTTIAYGKALGVPQVNCVSGLMPAGAALDDVEATLVDNLRHAAPRFADAGIRLQIEPVNPIDNPGAFLVDLDRFERVFEKVGSDNLFLQYDFYHQQIVAGDLMRNFIRLQPVINHVQMADNPGRHEPGTGEINYAFILAELERLAYAGWVGCEYVPRTRVAEGLGWLEDYRRRSTI